MERNYEDKYNIELIGRAGACIYKLPFYVLEITNRNLPLCYQMYFFGRYNPIEDCFYDQRCYYGTSIKVQNGDDIEALEEGMLVEYSEFSRGCPDIVIPKNPEINKELVGRKRLDYKALFEKYGDDLWSGKISFDINTIIENYCEKRLDEGKDVDPYIVDIIYVLSDPMGLKIKTNSQERGYNYPEEIEQIVGGLYELISLKFQEIEPFCEPHSIRFNNYGFVPTDYIEFNNQLEYISGICCGNPDLVNYIESEKYHQVSEEIIKRHKEMVPTFYFGKYESFFVEDSNDPNSLKKVIKKGEPYRNWSFLKRLNPETIEKVKKK